jgi:predicted NAD/FAD-dependent oxidoreductase
MAVVVVGAGLAGVACASELVAAGVPVRVLERAHAVGGRMASRRIDGRPVDLGAAYFTVRDPEFAQVVARWRTAGLARPWTSELAVLGTGEPTRAPGPVRWAAPGGLRSLVAALAEGLDVALQHEVRRVGPGPTVDGEAADAVVLAMPDPQARRLLAPGVAESALLDGRAWQSVITVAAGWQRREWAALPAAFVNDHPVLSLVADDGDRRGDGAPVLVAHTTNDEARRYNACPDDAVAPVLDALRQLLGLQSDPIWTHARRWRYAAPADSREDLFHLGDDGIGLAGDGWGSARVETAWRSGSALGRALVQRHAAEQRA